MFANKSGLFALFVICILLCCGLVVSWVGEAEALPWDKDMASQPSLKEREIARSPAVGTVPIGRKPFIMNHEEAAEKLVNPVLFSRDSVWRGRRLWNANCLPCHGRNGSGNGPVGPLMKAPNLLIDFYESRPDGRIFATIYHGQNLMPRYGYKFSEAELWDMINYLRFLQGRDVEGVSRPGS